jgi:hypothetical protein
MSALAAYAAPVVAPVATPEPKPVAAPEPNVGTAKKGLGIGFRKDSNWARKLQEVKASWFYSWGADVPEDIPEKMQFVPMIWGKSTEGRIRTAAVQAKARGIGQLLGFNEPDGPHQANMTVEEALTLWPVLMETGLRLGSPACAHSLGDWMKTFMKGVDDRKLRVDFICVHSYAGLNVEAFLGRLQEIHKLFQRPLWITELGVGDWQAKTREANRYHPDQIVRYLEQLLPRLETLDIVERYAWFPSKPESPALGPCALFNADGSLTKAGEMYSSL